MPDLRTALGPIGAWGHLDTLPAAALRAYAGRVAQLGFGCLWVPETVGREPFTLLGAVSAEAGEMWLGTSIVSIWGRDPMAARMGAMTLHELTEGRFVLGLGVSHPHLAQRLRGHEYSKPLTRMREYLDAYGQLPYRGPHPTDDDGTSTEPPVVLAALRERMLELAVTRTAGAFPYLVTPDRISWMRSTADHAVATGSPEDPARPFLAVTLPVVLEGDPGAARATARAYLAPYLRTPNYQASWAAQGFVPDDWNQPGTDGLVDAMVAWGSATDLVARIGAFHYAGADHVALIPLAPDGTSEHLATLEAIAPRIS